MANIVSTGTVTVTNGSVLVSGTGTTFDASLVAGGTLLVNGLSAFIASVTDDLNLVLTRPWPGATAADTEYEIQRARADVARVIIANDRLADAIARMQAGLFFDPDAIGTLAERAGHDDEAQGFIYMVPASVEGGSPTVYVKNSATSADWSPGQSLKGDKGDAGNPLATTTAFMETVLAAATAAAARATIGLVNVDNTSDLNKPVSTAQQAALDGKLAKADAGILAGHRNKIINGDFDIWQRGASHSVIGYTADRWYLFVASGGSCTVTRQDYGVGQSDVPGRPNHFLRFGRSVVGAGNSVITQRIEDVATLNGETSTLTFYARAAAATEFYYGFEQFFGTGGSPSASVWFGGAQIALTTAWQKFSVSVDIPSIAGKTKGTDGNHLLALHFTRLQTGSNLLADVELSHISLVPGDATAETDPFAPRHIGQELALCRRYFRRIDGGDGTKSIATLSAVNATTMRGPLVFPKMRTAPSLSASSNTHFTLDSPTAQVPTYVSGISAADDAITLNVGGAGFTAGQSGHLRGTTSSLYIDLDSEL